MAARGELIIRTCRGVEELNGVHGEGQKNQPTIV